MRLFQRQSFQINLKQQILWVNFQTNKLFFLQNFEGSRIKVKDELQNVLAVDAMFVVNIVAAIPSIKSIASFVRWSNDYFSCKWGCYLKQNKRPWCFFVDIDVFILSVWQCLSWHKQ